MSSAGHYCLDYVSRKLCAMISSPIVITLTQFGTKYKFCNENSDVTANCNKVFQLSNKSTYTAYELYGQLISWI
jgi:hypothetical protein